MRCLRPASACICQWIAPVHHSVQVLILQHPEEVAQAKGSARLLHLCLPNSRMVTGEVFEPQTLHDLLHRDKRSVLLYPSSPQGAAQGIAPAPDLPANVLQHPSQLQLVVLDATWRKSRKILYQNPALQALPRLALQHVPPSTYRIRKAHRPDQLSTLEATCAALRQLGADAGQLDALLVGFEGFVGQQMGYRRV
jgi:DTW domain-containing protein YfiP